MGEKLRKYFSTGEFAKICGVKKQTLFHYDDMVYLNQKLQLIKGTDTMHISK